MHWTKVSFLALLLIGCSEKEPPLLEPIDTAAAGIDFINTVEETDELNILDYLYFYNGGGVAAGDINGDGLPDLFFTGNQVDNRLYLNEGGLKFRDITDQAGVRGNSSWNTGAVMGDVNGDGLLDIYVCAVVGLKGFQGHNELYINNGDNTFTEQASAYGLDFDTYSSGAAFLDYDLDGDLDLYLLNHAVHTEESFGRASLRESRNYSTGDRLLRNDGESFTDVSEAAGIFGGVNGYGLGIAVSDFNQDGYPDLYIGNDFHEDDYYYINQGDGTFRNQLRENFGQTTRFSMGSDVADINNDGWPDLLSLDMLPEDEKVLKSSEGDDNIQTQKLRTERYGYHYQFTRNMLHVNQAGKGYQETALMSGIAATDWSWSALFADFNLDGRQDLFISNGIPKRPNDLDYINFVSNEQIQKKINNTKLVDQEAIELMPSGKVHNYIFQGTDSLRFVDHSGQWIPNDTLVSGATALADLDMDGDLDIVVNNLNSAPSLYINQIEPKDNFLQLQLRQAGPNPFGIGAKAVLFSKGKLQYREHYTTRGFQASSEPGLHFGLPTGQRADSLWVIWPDRSYQVISRVPMGQRITIEKEGTRPFSYAYFRPSYEKLFTTVSGNLGIDFTHTEDKYLDFNRQKLIPYMLSDRGPAVAAGDLNGDGKEDLLFGGSKFDPVQVFLQGDSSYAAVRLEGLARDSVLEVTAALIGDLQGDPAVEIVLGTGGADFYGKMEPLRDAYYHQSGNDFERSPLPEHFGNSSVVRAHDFDQDGDLDVFIGNQSVSADFGKAPDSQLLLNTPGGWKPMNSPLLKGLGMVTDAAWTDFNGDGWTDLLLVGEWMKPVFLANKKGVLEKVEMKLPSGLWQTVLPHDIDGDGDTDYLLGNWGLNSKFKASEEHPMLMYYGDLDTNGSTETVIALEKNGSYYPMEGLKGLSSQLISLRKKFPSYASFAGKEIAEVLGEEMLEKARVLEVDELRTGYLENVNGRYAFRPLGEAMQTAPVLTFLAYDFDGDSREEVLAAGNYFGVKPYHGRLGGFPGAMIKGKNDVILGNRLGLDLQGRSARDLHLIHLNKQPYLLVTFNNDRAQVYKLNTDR